MEGRGCLVDGSRAVVIVHHTQSLTLSHSSVSRIGVQQRISVSAFYQVKQTSQLCRYDSLTDVLNQPLELLPSALLCSAACRSTTLVQLSPTITSADRISLRTPKT